MDFKTQLWVYKKKYVFSCELTVVCGFRKFPAGLFKIGCCIYMPPRRSFKKLKIVLSHTMMTQWYQLSFPVLNWNSCLEGRGRESSPFFFNFLEGWHQNVVIRVGHIFSLEEVRGVKSQFPLTSLWKEATAYFCWMFILFLGNASLFLLWTIYDIFWKSRATAVCSEQLEKPEVHTDVGTKAFQSIILKQSQRQRSTSTLGFVWYVIIWNAVAASPEVEPE